MGTHAKNVSFPSFRKDLVLNIDKPFRCLTMMGEKSISKKRVSAKQCEILRNRNYDTTCPRSEPMRNNANWCETENRFSPALEDPPTVFGGYADPLPPTLLSRSLNGMREVLQWYRRHDDEIYETCHRSCSLVYFKYFIRSYSQLFAI